MPILGNALDFAKYEGRNFRGHQLGTAPSSPVTGQLYYNTADNTLYWWDGSAWVSARGGASATPPATTGSLGTVQLAGDLAGTATSPQIAAGVITDAEVAPSNKDGATGTASMRTLGYTAQKAMPGDARLDNIAAPITAVNMNGQALMSVADPASSGDAANKGYVDNVAQGLDAKASVKAATTANITLSGTQTIDGVAINAGDRVLVKNQALPEQNGIYVAAAGAWARATDMNTWAEVPGAFTFVEGGSSNATSGWVTTATATGSLGATAINWTQFSEAGQVVGGAGLTKTGNTLDVGAGAGITVNADTVQVANDGITNAMLADNAVNLAGADVTGLLPVSKGGTGGGSQTAARNNLNAPGTFSWATHSAGTTISYTQVQHGLRTDRGMAVFVIDEATGNQELPDVTISAIGTVTVTFGASVAANSKRVTIVG